MLADPNVPWGLVDNEGGTPSNGRADPNLPDGTYDLTDPNFDSAAMGIVVRRAG